MRHVISSLLFFIAGCAGQQAGEPPRATAVPVAAAPIVPVAAGPVTPVAVVPIAPSAQARIAEAKKMGYKLRDQDGEEYFCRTETKTGSRVARETVCLTAKDIDSLREQTQQNLSNVSRQIMQRPSN